MVYKTYGDWTITNVPVVRYNQYINDITQLKTELYELRKIVNELEVKKATPEEYTGRLIELIEVYRAAREHSGTVWPMDSNYKEPTLAALKKFLNVNEISDRDYEPQEYDCENFAIDTMSAVHNYFGNVPFGIVSLHNNNTGKGHMMNCCYVEGQWYFEEPQGDTFYKTLASNYTVKYLLI